jgi:amino acid adenylation domain-containing protein
MAAQFRRDVSPNEKLYLAGARIAAPFAIQIFVAGQGEVDVARLTRAVADASAACPGARLVLDGKQWVDSGVAPPVELLTIAAGDDGAAGHRDNNVSGRDDNGSGWDNGGSGQERPVRLGGGSDRNDRSGRGVEQLPRWRRPFDVHAGPTCEVVVVRHEARTTVVFRAFHGVMDGKGALVWLSEVWRAYRSEPLRPAAATMTDRALLARLGAAHRRAKPVFDCPSPLASPTATAPTRAQSDHGAFVWKRRTLAGAQPGLVARLAALLAANAAADARVRFMVPVDLRRHDPMLAATSNLSLPIFLEAQPAADWEALYEQLLGALAARRELAVDGSEGALAAMPIWALTGVLRASLRWRRRDHFAASAILSHLGRVDLNALSGGDFRAATVYSLPVHVPLAALSLVAVECGDHVELTLVCPDADAAAADALLDRVAAAVAVAKDESHAWAANETAAPIPDRTIAGLFGAEAARTPDAVALVCGTETVTYAELDRRSDAVAAALQARGIEPGAVVGLLVDRDPRAIYALLGILKAGAAYLPVDPQYPAERLGWLLADAKAALCLTTRAHAVELDGRFAGPIAFVDELARSAAVFSPVADDPRSLAYVLYTSGSTGRPKGVQIEQRSLVNYVAWAQRAYAIDATSRFALFTSLSFDLTATAIFPPLLAGGSIALVPEALDHLTLRKILHDSGANALKLTPTHLLLIAQLDGPAPVGFRTLVVGGEQLTSSLAHKAQARFGADCRIVNEYGPTEATIGCIWHVFDEARDGDGAAVPIGVPGSNMQAHLYDAQRRPVAPGVSGELYLAGACLARGYLDREELNRERFVTLPGGQRAYRTGDLARLNERGLLEFLGRADEQIKIRGHRIEPGEIAAILAAQPGVAQALVVGRPRRGGGEPILCAYYVARGSIDEAALRRALERQLPPFMIPSFIQPVDEIPLTVNGKADLRRLPDPAAAAASDSATIGTAATNTATTSTADDELAAAIAAIWAELLAVDAAALGPESDFHALGGDSLQMVQLLAAIGQRVVGAALEPSFMQRIRPILRRPTLAGLCAAVRDVRRAATESAA